MKLNKKELEDKIHACWVGKNIGGTMGTPYETQREMQDVRDFVSKPGEALPNDDLDLQLVWLAALERSGLSSVTPQLLGEYWLSFIGPHWNEYGIGKANMKQGMIPPLSGDCNNEWKHSNGAWIRTEIWASLEPGRPDFAARYAAYDAGVDHGAGEGTYAAVFVAAMQSTAFVSNDIRECIDVGLSKIPSDCRLAQSVRLAIECYEKKLPLCDARNLIQQSNADIGDGWFEAPSNVGYVILGLLYGEGDFKRSVICAINCGDDTDCTGATVGATMGILGGMKAIPEDWSAYIGDRIITVAIDRGTLYEVPETCEELTQRVIKQTGIALQTDYIGAERIMKYQHVRLTDSETCFEEGREEYFRQLYECPSLKEYLERELLPNSFSVDFDYARGVISLENGTLIRPGEEKKLRLRFFHNGARLGGYPLRLNLKWYLPDGFRVSGPKFAALNPYRDLKNDLEFYHSLPDGTHTDNSAAYGYLYLYSEKGDPATRFDSIEFLPWIHGASFRGGVHTPADDVPAATLDNLCFRYVGLHGIACGHINELTVQYCEFGWIGGSIQQYYSSNGGRYPTRIGNAVEVYGGCNRYTVDHCYIYQIYDAGVTVQYSASPAVMQNITFTNNLIERCVYAVELWNKDTSGVMDHIYVADNIMRFTGYGFGVDRYNPYYYTMSMDNFNLAAEKDIVFERNVFDRSAGSMTYIGRYEGDFIGIYRDNIFVQLKGNGFGISRSGEKASTRFLPGGVEIPEFEGNRFYYVEE